jgi:membrane associated rhomboid family serine protease
MPRYNTVQFALPEFTGVTRRLVLANVLSFFLLLIVGAARILPNGFIPAHLALYAPNFLSGEVWQIFTYSFVQLSLSGTLWSMLALWFMGSLLEDWHGSRWFTGVYFASVLGCAAAAVMASLLGSRFGLDPAPATVSGCLGGNFGLLAAIGLLHGDIEFRVFFVLPVKARYLAAISGLIALAMAFGEMRIFAIAELGGALGAILYIRLAPRRGFNLHFSESWYGLRNRYFRWKRRRAASKFEVYMKKQGRTVRFDGQGHLIDEDEVKHQDRKRWN